VKQVVQAINGGPVRVIDAPRPTIGATEVLVRTVTTTISPGTERAVTALAQSSLIDKARARPDLVKQVISKARAEGLASTARAVRARLDEDMPLGYSGAGIAVAVGDAVQGIKPGDLVATGGASKANHAEFQAVPAMLCVRVPDGVSANDASMATIASIALHGVRLAEIEPGSRVVVVGLGLVGQLAVRLAQAAGADVFGIDLDPLAVERTIKSGAAASVEHGDDTTRAVLDWSRGRGADAVIVAAAGHSSAVMGRAPDLCRDRASVVVVGDVGLDLDRRPYYDRELTIRFARSYGPGRYERSYEDWGVDYPPGLVRFTEGRNLETVLDLLAADRLRVDDLITHRFDIAEATKAYELVETRDQPFVGIQLTYPALPDGATPDELAAAEGPIRLRTPRPARGQAVPATPSTAAWSPRSSSRKIPGVGLIGAGSFATTVLLPSLQKARFNRLVAVASASGLSARHLAERAGFEQAVSGADAVINDPDVDVVVIATPHDTHAALAAAALRAGKHVFCEKPLALSFDELVAVEQALASTDAHLFVGFNRRWSSPVAQVRDHLGTSGGPLVITYRVNAGTLPPTHWYHDRRQGGRLLGEVCHFVDTCAAIVGSPADGAHAVASGASNSELVLSQDVALVLHYPDGSVASITYAAGGHTAVEKERIEVLGRGHAATIVDFREVVLDGKASVVRPQDKGHGAEARAFFEIVQGRRTAGDEAISSTRTTLTAAASLGTPLSPKLIE
jgi:predicted dehydrogenase/threonine dehydrogenase-like Zn-dependent dehydrogenase